MRYSILIVVAVLLFATTAMAQTISLNAGSVTGIPGGVATLTVSLNDASASVRVNATGNDLTFDNSKFSVVPSSCHVASALMSTKSISSGIILVAGTNTTLRVFVNSPFSSTPIPDGALYTCDFDVAPGIALGSYTISNTNEIAQDVDGNFFSGPTNTVDGSGTDGTIVIADPTNTPTPTITRTPTRTQTRTRTPTNRPTMTPNTVPIHIDADSVSGIPNGQVVLPITLNDELGSDRVGSIQADLAFDNTKLSIDVATCVPSTTLEDLDFHLSSGVVLVSGATTTFRVSVQHPLGSTSSAAMPDGIAALCTFIILGSTSAGTYTITTSNEVAGDVNTNYFASVTGANGSIIVSTPGLCGFVHLSAPAATSNLHDVFVSGNVGVSATKSHYQFESTVAANINTIASTVSNNELTSGKEGFIDHFRLVRPDEVGINDRTVLWAMNQSGIDINIGKAVCVDSPGGSDLYRVKECRSTDAANTAIGISASSIMTGSVGQVIVGGYAVASCSGTISIGSAVRRSTIDGKVQAFPSTPVAGEILGKALGVCGPSGLAMLVGG